jgi:MoaD family protein
MITVTVRYLAGFSQAVGRTTEEVRLPTGATLSALIETLKKRHGRNFSSLLAKDDSYRNVLFLRRGAAIDGKTELAHRDEIIISLPVGGG